MGNNNLVDIGKRIKEQRKKNNLTQEELAAQLLVSREKVNYWETGSRDIKTGDLVALAKALNTTSDYLLGIERGTTPAASALMDAIGLAETSIKYLSDDNNAKVRKLFDFLISAEIEWEEDFSDGSRQISFLGTLCRILDIANAPNNIHINVSSNGEIEFVNILRKDGEGFVVDYKTTKTSASLTGFDVAHGVDLSDYLSDVYISHLGELLKTYHRKCHEIKKLSSVEDGINGNNPQT